MFGLSVSMTIGFSYSVSALTPTVYTHGKIYNDYASIGTKVGSLIPRIVLSKNLNSADADEDGMIHLIDKNQIIAHEEEGDIKGVGIQLNTTSDDFIYLRPVTEGINTNKASTDGTNEYKGIVMYLRMEQMRDDGLHVPKVGWTEVWNNGIVTNSYKTAEYFQVFGSVDNASLSAAQTDNNISLPNVNDPIDTSIFTISNDGNVMFGDTIVGTVEYKAKFETVIEGNGINEGDYIDENTYIIDHMTGDVTLKNGNTKVGTAVMKTYSYSGLDRFAISKDEADKEGKYVFYYYIDSGSSGILDDNPLPQETDLPSSTEP